MQLIDQLDTSLVNLGFDVCDELPLASSSSQKMGARLGYAAKAAQRGPSGSSLGGAGKAQEDRQGLLLQAMVGR
jgi:hypothetical protein